MIIIKSKEGKLIGKFELSNCNRIASSPGKIDSDDNYYSEILQTKNGNLVIAHRVKRQPKLVRYEVLSQEETSTMLEDWGWSTERIRHYIEDYMPEETI